MRKGILGSLAVLALGAGSAFGQYGPPPGPGGYPQPSPDVMPGPGAVSGPSATGTYGPESPMGQPLIMPPGMDGMVPPGAQGMGSPGGAYPGANRGILYSIFNGTGGPTRFWFSADYLFWIPKSQDLRFPLVTTSAAADLGVLGGSTTVDLFGPGSNSSYDQVNGFRFLAGYSIDGDVGVEANAFMLETAKQNYSIQSNSAGLPLLAVPYFDLDSGGPGSILIAFPGVSAGRISEEAWTRVRSLEASLVYNAYSMTGEAGGLAMFVGARYFSLEESLSFGTTSSSFGVPPAGLGSTFFPAGGGFFAGSDFTGLAPFTVSTVDRTRTFNQFFGANVGFRGDIGFGKWVLQATGKIAAGFNRSWVDVEGNSTLAASTGLRSTQPGGIFNGPQDLGRHHKDRFSLLPEGGLNLGYQLTPQIRLNLGYTFIYMTNVVRPHTSITQNLNPTLVPSSPTYSGAFPPNYVPRNVTRDDEFHLHGFNLGLQLNF